MLSVTLMGFGSIPILAKVTLLEKQKKKSPKVTKLRKILML